MTTSNVETFIAKQTKTYADMTPKQKEAYIDGIREAERKDGLASELVQIVALKARKSGEILKPQVIDNANGTSKTIRFRVRRADVLKVDGEIVDRKSVPAANTDEGKAYRKDHTVTSVFATVSAYAKNEQQGLIDFYANLKPGTYYNLRHIINKANDEKGWLTAYNMFEAKALNHNHKQATQTVDAQDEDLPF